MIKDIEIKKELPSIVIPEKATGAVLRILKAENLLPNIKGLQYIFSEENGKRILLSENVNQLPQSINDLNSDLKIEKTLVVLDYKNFTLQELLRAFIPEHIVIPSSFETIGHIAHLNLQDEHAPYKHLIGEAIILKNSNIKTVAAKVGAISSVYRSMDLEVLAGESNFVTEVHQSGFMFKLDFSKVYWNSRLQHEHDSVVETFKEGSLVCDAMCGIGPFAVRAAKIKRCTVLANDLNPDSYKWLKENCELNGVAESVFCFNMDAREFIKKVFREGGCDYIVMNLPGTAIEFLDAIGESAILHKDTARMPIVVFHAFDTKEDHFEKSLKERAQRYLGLPLPNMTIKIVRDISPGKNMFRCSFSTADIFLRQQ